VRVSRRTEFCYTERVCHRGASCKLLSVNSLLLRGVTGVFAALDRSNHISWTACQWTRPVALESANNPGNRWSDNCRRTIWRVNSGITPELNAVIPPSIDRSQVNHHDPLRVTPKPCRSYHDAVLTDNIIAGRYVQFAVERHLDDLEHAQERGLQFDAGKSLRFVEAVCTHQKAEWANQPFLLSPNQQFIPLNLTGWPRENGCRRFRRVALLIYCNA